ncbi:MAG: hypothetical protein ACI94O_002412 [Octadecabacter sp.]|jgi:hypothetical protein
MCGQVATCNIRTGNSSPANVPIIKFTANVLTNVRKDL